MKVIFQNACVLQWKGHRADHGVATRREPVRTPDRHSKDSTRTLIEIKKNFTVREKRKRGIVRFRKHSIPRYTARNPTAEGVWGMNTALIGTNLHLSG